MDDEKDSHRFMNLARVFDRTVPALVPSYDFLQWETIRLFNFDQGEDFFLIDLGGGSGHFAEKVLSQFPKAEVCLVDFSTDFLDVARKRLARFEERVTFIHADVRAGWEKQTGRKAELITSMSTIHHLLPEEKQLVYQKAYRHLKQGGWFFNIDEMKTLNHQAYRNSLAFWRDHVESFYTSLKNEHQDYEYFQLWRPFYEDWKDRTFTENPPPLESSVDKHQPFTDQLAWLAEIGFTNVDLFIKYHLWCVIGGKKQ